MTGEQKPGGLEGEGLSTTYRFAYESIRKGAPGLSNATCMAIARSINMKVSIAANARATAAEAKLARAVEGLERIAAATPGSTNSKYADEAFSWTAAVANTALAALQQAGEVG